MGKTAFGASFRASSDSQETIKSPTQGYRLKSGSGLALLALPHFFPPRMNDPVLHATVYFSGHVQGVGFRYSTLQVAKEFDVAGYVKNLPDGRVLVETEGQPKTVEQFLAAVTERMHGHVRKTERVQQSRPPSFQGFEIR